MTKRNQWQGSLENIKNKIDLFKKANINESKISYCTKNLKFSGKELNENIEIIKKDTFTRKNKFYSARYSQKKNYNDYGRNISLIMIK